MKNCKIVYRVLGIPLVYKFRMPEKWEQVSARQMTGIAMLSDNAAPGHTAISLITGVPSFIARRIHPFDVYVLVKQLDFVKNQPQADRFFIPSISIRKRFLFFPLPGKTTYMLPRPRLAGMPFGQFIFVDTFFNDFITGHKLTDLYSFLASLMMLPGEKFTEDFEKNLELRTKHARRIPPATIMALMANYQLVHQWLMARYPIVFPGKLSDKDEKNDQATDKNLNAKKTTDRGWLKVFESIVGDDIISELKYAQTSVNRIMRFLTDKLKENAKRK